VLFAPQAGAAFKYQTVCALIARACPLVTMCIMNCEHIKGAVTHCEFLVTSPLSRFGLMSPLRYRQSELEVRLVPLLAATK